MDTGKVTRFELIDASFTPRGAAPDRYTRLGVSVKLSLQDDGRTLKVFLDDSPVAIDAEVNAQMRSAVADWDAAQ